MVTVPLSAIREANKKLIEREYLIKINCVQDSIIKTQDDVIKSQYDNISELNNSINKEINKRKQYRIATFCLGGTVVVLSALLFIIH